MGTTGQYIKEIFQYFRNKNNLNQYKAERERVNKIKEEVSIYNKLKKQLLDLLHEELKNRGKVWVKINPNYIDYLQKIITDDDIVFYYEVERINNDTFSFKPIELEL